MVSDKNLARHMNADELVEARLISTPLAVDAFDDPAWELCKPVQLSWYWSGKPAPAHRHAEARLLWSDTALHVRFTCPQAEPLIMSSKPQTRTKTLGLWDRDVCEIYIAPDAQNPSRYFEFEGSPKGEWVDIAIEKKPEGRESNFAYNSGMRAAGRVQPNQVWVSLLIPWSQVIPKPNVNERWRANLFRCVGSDPDRGYVTWRPTYAPEPSFHEPDAFGLLLFC